MTHIPNDFHSRYTTCLGKGDRVEATRLSAIITAAKASGNATGGGWDDDLAQLAAIVEGRPVGLAKRFTPTAVALPPDLRAKAISICHAIEHAETPVEKAAAAARGETFIAELAGRNAIAKALGEPKKMGVAGCAAA